MIVSLIKYPIALRNEKEIAHRLLQFLLFISVFPTLILYLSSPFWLK